MSAALIVTALALIVVMLAQHRALARAITAPPPAEPRLARHPSLTVIRPIRGLDVDAAENLRALLASDYPGELEVLFVLDDAADPAFPVVEAELRRYHGRARTGILFCGAPPPGRTGKLNAMIVALARARGELVGFSDSDTRPGPELLRRSVETLLTTPRAGDVFVPVVVADPPRRAGDVAYGLMQNAWYGPSVARAAGPSGELPFIMGQLMIWTREAIDAIGGLSRADGQLVDDMFLGRCVAEAGLRNVMTRDRLPIATGGMGIGEFTGVMRRWLLFSRNGLPSAFTLPSWFRGVFFWLSLALVWLALSAHATAALPLAALAVGVSVWSQVRLGRAFGGAPLPLRYLWVPLTLPLVAPLIVLSAIFYPRVDWRGRPYALASHAQLAREP